MPTGSRQLLGVWQRFRPDAPGAGHAVRHRQRTGPTELESSFRVGAGPKVSAGLTVQPMRVPGTPFPWPGQGHKTRRPRDRPQRQDIRNERIREEGSKVGLRCTTGCTDRDQARGVERSHRLETLHRELPGPVADLPEIPSHLHPQPSFRCRAEGFRQPYRHLDRNPVRSFKSSESARRVTPRPSAARVTLRPRGSRHCRLTMPPGCGGLCIPMPGLLGDSPHRPQRPPRRPRTGKSHASFLIPNPHNAPSTRANGAPQVHALRSAAEIERRQNIPQPLHVRRRDKPARPAFVERLQPAMPDDAITSHSYRVACQLAICIPPFA